MVIGANAGGSAVEEEVGEGEASVVVVGVLLLKK